MRCRRSPSLSFVADRIERGGGHSWKECAFSTEARHHLLVKLSFLYPHMLLFLLSQAFSAVESSAHASLSRSLLLFKFSLRFCFTQPFCITQPFCSLSRLLRSSFCLCSCELVPFASAVLLLPAFLLHSAFLLIEPSAQELFLSLLV